MPEGVVSDVLLGFLESFGSSNIILPSPSRSYQRWSVPTSVKVTYLGIRSAHERVWLVEGRPIWLPRAYLTRGDLEPARGNVHLCKLVRERTNIQIRTVTAERHDCSKCICPTNALQLYEVRKEGRKEGRREPEGEREGRKEGRKEN